jgi:Glycosyl hydrolase family 99
VTCWVFLPMKIKTVGAVLGAAAWLLTGCAALPGEQESGGSQQQAVQKSDPRKIYVHLMPWFETPGYHWDMVGRHYNPQIGPYHSGDYKVIEYQLLLMKFAGIDGVIIDWPGRNAVNKDLPANAENTDQIIAQTAKFGMQFAVCFEDQYAVDTNDAINSMHWVRDHYFNQPNHIKENGVPALFVFGPQKIAAADWPAVLAATGVDPMFFTLWYNDKAGGARDGTFAWLYSDALTGVGNYYNRPDQGTKVSVLYPGFNAAYGNGAPGWSIAYDLNGGDTLAATYNLSKGVGDMVQIATWNDYTEGTMVEPTNERGYGSLTTLQKVLGVAYGQAELEIVRKLYDLRKANDPKADAASTALINSDFVAACAQLGCTAPNHPGTGGSPSGGGGSSTGTAGSSNPSAGTSTTGTAGSAPMNGTGGSGGAAQPTGGTVGDGTTAGTDATDGDSKANDSGGCSLRPSRSSGSGYLLVAAALMMASRRRRRAGGAKSMSGALAAIRARARCGGR